MRCITYSSDIPSNQEIPAWFQSQIKSDLSAYTLFKSEYKRNETIDYEEICYYLMQTLLNFPEQSIHLFFSNYFMRDGNIIILEINNQLLFLPDNGMVSHFENLQLPYQVYLVNADKITLKAPIKELYKRYEMIIKTLENQKLSQIGLPYENFKRFIPFSNDFFPSQDQILFRTIFTTPSGHVITNFSKANFDFYVKNRSFFITIVDPKFRIEQISSYIDEIYSQNELCAFFNEMGLLEIFMVNENMVKILNIQKNTKVRLDFND